MNPSYLLGKTFTCECGQKHSVAIREIIYSESAINEAGDILGRNFQKKAAVLIADQRTFAAAGKALARSLTNGGFKITSLFLPDGKGGKDPVCDDNTLDYIRGRLPECDFYLAVGSGVISDLTKWLASETHKPYATLATAAS
ncbi:MAG: iron-containing alcohol dehydrogenase, partial [Kiritimatiellia bacterium]|nr:iron-containing alcohol dehydrogenase [Kiritimatiellia bacterium]